jgi:hypothetical protein
MKPKIPWEVFILEFIRDKKYFSTRAIRAEAARRKLNYSATTINQYLYNLKSESKLYDAGRGWYSTISRSFVQDTRPVQELASRLKNNFPLLHFSCWSTEQLQGFAHHVLLQFTSFVYTDADSMSPVAESLKESSYNVHLNPQKNEVKKYFSPSARTIVVRPSVSEEPVEGTFATVEKMLVDLFVEKEKLFLADAAEYNRIFENLVLAHRIKMASLLRYAYRRKVRTTFVKQVLCEFGKEVHF